MAALTLTLAIGSAGAHEALECSGLAPFSVACVAAPLEATGHASLHVEITGFVGEFEARLEQGPLAYVIHCTALAVPDLGDHGPTQCTTQTALFHRGAPLRLTCRADPLPGQPAPSGPWSCRAAL